ncbi:MAG: hypothetical protein U1F25_19855 [Rubrivivax sp.]
MISGRKFFWMALVLYSLTVFLPAFFIESDIASDESVIKAVLACALFLAGLALGTAMFPLLPADPALRADDETRRGFRLLAGLMLLAAGYVALIGPRSPMIEAMVTGDTFGAALAREDAIKLNPDVGFVRVYVLARDVLAPASLTLAYGVLTRWRHDRPSRWLAVATFIAAAYVALWSGQKATIVNYAIAAFLYWQTDARTTLRRLLVAAPLGLALVAGTFFAMQPELFTRDYDLWHTLEVFGESIFNRLLTVPLDVAAIYVHSLDVLGIIHPSDGLPANAWVWPITEPPIESKIGVEFFHQGIDSSHSNSLAFAYAYVAGGLLGCVAGGIATMALLRWSIRIVAANGSQFLFSAYAAYLCYRFIDLLNGNYLYYLLTNIPFAVLVWLIGHVWPKGRTARHGVGTAAATAREGGGAADLRRLPDA